jgi:DNA polymerase IV
MHLDMDAFFAAVEQRDRPEIRGKPVMVGSLPGSRGVVSTCSYEARVYGIHSGMPISEAFRRCPQGVYLTPDFHRYKEASLKMMEILRGLSPIVEQVSVDEAFVDLTGMASLWGDVERIALEAKGALVREIRLTGSVGIGPNRLIAKIASDFQKPDGMTVVREEEVIDFLAPLDVRKIWGIGEKTEQTLGAMGIHLVSDLQRIGEADLVRRFGEKWGSSLYRRARGIASDAVGGRDRRKTISKERTYQEDTTDQETIRTTLVKLAAGVGRIARGEGVKGHGVSVKVRLSGFETHTIQNKLDYATDLDHEIFQAGWRLYHNSPYRGRPVRLIGVGIFDLREEGDRQLDLFHPVDELRERSVYEAMDKIGERFGRGSIGVASSLKKKKKKE